MGEKPQQIALAPTHSEGTPPPPCAIFGSEFPYVQINYPLGRRTVYCAAARVWWRLLDATWDSTISLGTRRKQQKPRKQHNPMRD